MNWLLSQTPWQKQLLKRAARAFDAVSDGRARKRKIDKLHAKITDSPVRIL
ncbi:hypothetical protein [Bradyrhizobium diazoefficiens]|uniref:hypothetical protein n=1 Tax=Bradyrhizobium diazoefficiens TaxID=1355477 RepID=UPI00272DA4F0|nr:hypothetical protein [Bradyrhizobium diazoefficiens]WLA67658.1 hypothetical protein QNN01_13835 [Bradyrhizobium diazoefficiens]